MGKEIKGGLCPLNEKKDLCWREVEGEEAAGCCKFPNAPSRVKEGTWARKKTKSSIWQKAWGGEHERRPS